MHRRSKQNLMVLMLLSRLELCVKKKVRVAAHRSPRALRVTRLIEVGSEDPTPARLLKRPFSLASYLSHPQVHDKVRHVDQGRINRTYYVAVPQAFGSVLCHNLRLVHVSAEDDSTPTSTILLCLLPGKEHECVRHEVYILAFKPRV